MKKVSVLAVALLLGVAAFAVSAKVSFADDDPPYQCDAEGQCLPICPMVVVDDTGNPANCYVVAAD